MDSSEYDSALEESKKKAGGIGSALSTAATVGGAAIAAISTAAVGMTSAFVAGTNSVATYGDNIDKMSQKMGLSAEAYQEWDAVLRHSGSSIDAMKTGMRTLANAVETDSEEFAKLGLSMEEVRAMSQEDLFAAVITGLQDMEEGSERTYITSKLLGRGATELGALLNTSSEETDAMRKRVHELGGVMSDEAVKASAKYRDSLQDMSTAFDGLKRNMMVEFLPSVTTVMDGLTELFAGGDGLPLISEGVSSFVDHLGSMTPRLFEVGSSILLALSDAVIENLPVLIDTATDTIMSLGSYIVRALPKLVTSGLEIIMQIANSIIDSLPELIPVAVDVLLQIIDTLTDPENLSQLVDAAIAITIALANGLISSLPKLLEKAPEIISNLVAAIIENVPKLLTAAWEVVIGLVTGIIEYLPQIGRAAGEIISTLLSGLAGIWEEMLSVGSNIVNGIWEGISGAAEWLWGKVTGFVSNIVGGVKSVLGIQSPSKVFAGIGEMMAAGLSVGFEDEMEETSRTINKELAGLTDDIATVGFGNVDFASSGLAKTSAAMINSFSAGEQVSGAPVVVQVVLPDGTEVARAWLPDFLRAASAAGTPLTA